jgi:hypothetical protein
MASTGLLAPDTLGLRLRRRGHHELILQAHAFSSYLVRWIGVLSVIGQNKLIWRTGLWREALKRAVQ